MTRRKTQLLTTTEILVDTVLLRVTAKLCRTCQLQTKMAPTIRTRLSLTWNVHRFPNRNWIAQIQVTVTEVHDSSKSINIRQIYWRNRIFRYVSMDHSERIANGSVLRRTTLLTLSHKVRFENVSTESVVLKFCLVESHLDTRGLVVQRNWKKTIIQY